MKASKRLTVSTQGARQIGPEKDRTLRLVGTDETPDTYDTILSVDGWDLRRYRKNPVFMWAHDSQSLPVGRTLRIQKSFGKRIAENGKEVEVKQLAFDVQFADRETYPFADVVYRLYQKGFLRGSSVGFETLKKRDITDEDELRELGFKKGRGAVLEQNELVELSGAPIPSNENALAEELKALAPSGARAWFNDRAASNAPIDAKWLADAFMEIRKVQALEREAARAEHEHDHKPQVVVFSKTAGTWTAETAMAWLEEQGLKSDDATETDDDFRFTQFSPDVCEGKFQTKTEGLPEGVSMIACAAVPVDDAPPAEPDAPPADVDVDDVNGTASAVDAEGRAVLIRLADAHLASIENAMTELESVRVWIQQIVETGELPSDDGAPADADADAPPADDTVADLIPAAPPGAASGSDADTRAGHKKKKKLKIKRERYATIDELIALFARAEKRFAGCMMNAAKKTDLQSVELQLNDLASEVRAIRDKRGAQPTPRGAGAPKRDPYEALLAQNTDALERLAGLFPEGRPSQ